MFQIIIICSILHTMNRINLADFVAFQESYIIHSVCRIQTDHLQTISRGSAFQLSQRLQPLAGLCYFPQHYGGLLKVEASMEEYMVTD